MQKITHVIMLAFCALLCMTLSSGRVFAASPNTNQSTTLSKKTLSGTRMNSKGTPATEAVRIAAKGTALLPIIVAPTATPRVRTAADTLATVLGRIVGDTFSVRQGDGSSGIVVGLPGDFPRLPSPQTFPTDLHSREEYLLRSGKRGLWLLGASDLAVEHAIWDVLYRLGYRQFFPGPVWEVIPSQPNASLTINVRESPDFYSRRIWYNWGTLDYNAGPYRDWCAKNRQAQGFRLNSGHAYETIINANKAEFNQHPEYFALVDGQRKTGGDAKFCIANPGLRKLVVEWAVRTVKANPGNDSISLEPSDGGNWCQCEACAAMGSVSDRAVTLANDVAKAINAQGLGDKYVGMYAYNRHCAPPAIPVDPHVIISSTTAFITGGFTQDQIIDGWQARGAVIGIYDYYSVVDWDWNMPGRAKASQPVKVASSIRKFYDKGARYYDAEAGDCWGPCGLGYYIASRVMWDIKEADRVQELTEDFLTRAFGPAKEPMRQFYRLLNFDTARRPTSDLLGRLYRALNAARTAANGRADVLARIDQLILYTRYAELCNAWSTGKGKRDDMLAFAWQHRATMMVHVHGAWAITVGQKAVQNPAHPLKATTLSPQEPKPQHGGTDGTPVDTDVLIRAILKNGIANNPPVEMGFTPVEFSENLVPATPLKLPAVEPGAYPTVPQDVHRYLVWVANAPAKFTLKVTVQRVWALRPHKITLTSPQEVTGKPVDVCDIVRPDGQTYDVTLNTPYQGLHQIDLVDGGDYTRIVWPEDVPVIIPSAIDTPTVNNQFRGKWTLYCYVPKGTKVVGGWAGSKRPQGVLKDGDGRVVCDFSKAGEGWFCVPVAPGQDGRLWKFEQNQGTRLLMTVPPYLARSERDLLLPREVVERDAR